MEKHVNVVRFLLFCHTFLCFVIMSATLHEVYGFRRLDLRAATAVSHEFMNLFQEVTSLKGSRRPS